MSRYAPTPEVMAIGQLNISGNITPANWWKHIRLSGLFSRLRGGGGNVK